MSAASISLSIVEQVKRLSSQISQLLKPEFEFWMCKSGTKTIDRIQTSMNFFDVFILSKEMEFKELKEMQYLFLSGKLMTEKALLQCFHHSSPNAFEKKQRVSKIWREIITLLGAPSR